MSGPLADLRVVELCSERGAWAGKLLADMRADVVKVEPPGGDRTRTYPPFLDDEPGPERSLYFWHYNTSKRGVTLDLESDAGRDAFRRLAARADILLEDRDPGVMAALGLDFPDLQPSNERLIYVSITPFGRNAPRANEPANDLTILAGGGPAGTTATTTTPSRPCVAAATRATTPVATSPSCLRWLPSSTATTVAVASTSM